MPWYQLLTVAGVPTVISGLFMLAINRNLNRRDEKRRKEEEEKEKARMRAEQEAAKRDAAMAAQNSELEKQNKALMLGVQAMLRDRLLQGYRHYFDKGWADYDDRENLENVWKQYHELGANGIMDGYRERFLALPVAKDNEMEE